MIRIINFLITGTWHIHRYEVHKEYATPIEHTIISRCKFCGKITTDEIDLL